jgi:hypothetical protein
VRHEQGTLANRLIKRVSPNSALPRIEPVLQLIANLEIGLVSSGIGRATLRPVPGLRLIDGPTCVIIAETVSLSPAVLSH